MNHVVLPELLEITFEAILPGRQQHDQRYTKHPTILKFLAEITTMLLDTSKRLRVDFCRSSEETKRENHVSAPGGPERWAWSVVSSVSFGDSSSPCAHCRARREGTRLEGRVPADRLARPRAPARRQVLALP